jgi:hypothetical protein
LVPVLSSVSFVAWFATIWCLGFPPLLFLYVHQCLCFPMYCTVLCF